MENFYKKLRPVTISLLMTGASTGIFSNSMAIFIAPVCEELGFERSAFSLISSIMLFFSMAALPFFGKFLPTVNLKGLIGVCAAVCSATILGYSFCEKIWAFYILAAINGAFVNGITLLSAAAMIKRLSIPPSGLIFGAAFSGAGVFSFLRMPILQKTTRFFGWRWGYRVQAILGAAILFTAVLLIENDLPQNKEEKSVSFVKAIKNRAFLLMAAGLFLANAANLALFNHTAANLTDIGFSAEQAAGVLSVAALFSSVSKPLFGVALDKLGPKCGAIILGASISLTAASALLLTKTGGIILLFPLLLSFCGCANSIPANAFSEKLFKDNYYAAASLLSLFSTAGSAVGTPAAGAVYDIFGGYHIMWWICIAAGVISAAVMCLAVFMEEKG